MLLVYIVAYTQLYKQLNEKNLEWPEENGDPTKNGLKVRKAFVCSIDTSVETSQFGTI